MKVITLPNTLGLLIASCLLANTPALAANSDPQLDKQIQNFWSAQAKRDWNGIYDLLSTKEKTTNTRAGYSEFRNKTAIFDFINPKTKDMEIVGDLAWVAVEFDAKVLRYPNAPLRHAQNWQLWQKTDGWHPVAEAERKQYPTLPPKLRLSSEEEALNKRVQAAWDNKKTENWKSFYDFLSPAYKSVVTVDEFLTKKAQYLYPAIHVDWVEVAQTQKEKDKIKGNAKITFSIKPNDIAATKLEAQERNQTETWIKQNGEWYFDIPLPKGKTKSAQTTSTGAKL